MPFYKKAEIDMAQDHEKHEAVRVRIEEAAGRALAEAEARRAERAPDARPKEVSGPAGPEPTRYGDWEKKGILSDF